MSVARTFAPMLLVPSIALAGTGYDSARVVDVEPVYRTVSYAVPTEECRLEQVAVHDHRGHRHGARSHTIPIIGAIIGGAIGNAVGHHKSNKQVGAVVGAILGGSIGRDIAWHHRHDATPVSYREEEVCRMVNETREEVELTGYRVTYQYAGQTHTTMMDRDPGKFVRVRVRVTPA